MRMYLRYTAVTLKTYFEKDMPIQSHQPTLSQDLSALSRDHKNREALEKTRATDISFKI